MASDLGRYGVWQVFPVATPGFAAEVERLGYGTLWLGGSPGDLDVAEAALAATEHLTVATGIVNVWTSPAEQVAGSWARVTDRFPGRFLLGIGIGHPERHDEYRSPFETLAGYVDRLSELDVPADQIVLAALRPRVLRLAGERTRGAHPYLVTPEHTRRAREILGDGPLLAPEQKFLVGGPDAQTRATARAALDRYLKLTNYLNNLRDLGWTDADLGEGGSDELVDALVLQGTPDQIATGVEAHLAAGADHVCVQAIGDNPIADLTALAPALRLAGG